MWKRINYAEWIDLVPVVAFIITFTVFLILVTRTMLMKKSQINHLASLPLEEGSVSVLKQGSVGVPPSPTTPVPSQP